MGRYSKKSKKLKTKKLNQQVYDILSEKFNEGFGRSRHEDKKIGLDKKYIYSKQTYETYKRECKHFTQFCRENYACKTLAECKEHIEDYLKYVAETKSAWTVSTKAAAICKMYEISIEDLEIELPKRQRQDIVRSRKAVAYDKHISDETEEFYAAFTRCTGLRIREMKRIKGTDLIERDGVYYVNVVNGKGGKARKAQVIGSDSEIEKVARLFKDAGTGKVFAKVHAALDNHSYRAEYATRFYHMTARDIDTLPQEEKYCCRKDLRGVVYDKKAMDIVSKNLGHNRRDVIAYSYIRY